MYEKCKFDSWSVPGNPGASSDVADKVLLQEIDANDYVTILFNPRGLVARLSALAESGVTTLAVRPVAQDHASRLRLIEQVRGLIDRL